MTNPDVDYYEFVGMKWCEKCGRETCTCPKYVKSQFGTILWMHEDIGAMMICIEKDVEPRDMIGQCYHEIDPETGVDHVYQLADYMTGPLHGCVFQVKRVGDRYTLPDERGHMRGMGWKPRITATF
jgi:hypothetical protein